MFSFYREATGPDIVQTVGVYVSLFLIVPVMCAAFCLSFELHIMTSWKAKSN